MLAVALFVFSIKYYNDLKKSESIALENGVNDEDYDILKIGLWFYIVPPTLAFLFPVSIKFYIIPFLILCYLPSIFYGNRISKKLDRGYDYVRNLSQKVNQIVWVGYSGIVLVIFNWLLIYANILRHGI